jgi:hypothetical protein
MTDYSNPRTEAIIEDWPYGQHRTMARFFVETHPTRGQRVGRITINPKTGRPTAPKFLAYAEKVVIVDGDDSKIYIVMDRGHHFFVSHGNMQYQHEVVFANNPKFEALRALCDSVGNTKLCPDCGQDAQTYNAECKTEHGTLLSDPDYRERVEHFRPKGPGATGR